MNSLLITSPYFVHVIYQFDLFQALSAAGSSPWSPVSTCQTPAASPSAVTSVKVVRNPVILYRCCYPLEDPLIRVILYCSAQKSHVPCMTGTITITFFQRVYNINFRSTFGCFRISLGCLRIILECFQDFRSRSDSF